MTPKISVIMPVYNAMPYLPMAIESVINQTFTDWELIIIYGNCTDDSENCAREYAARDNRIRVVCEPMRGVWRALNTGIERCRADIIARMDGDDICLPERFAKQYQFLQNHPEIIAVGGYMENIDKDSLPQGRFSKPPCTHTQLRNQMTACNVPFCHPTVMMRRDPLIKSGQYRDICCEDADLWHRLSQFGQFANIPEVLVYYRIHGNNASMGVNAQLSGNRFHHARVVSQFKINQFFGYDKYELNPEYGFWGKIILIILIRYYQFSLTRYFNSFIYVLLSPPYLWGRVWRKLRGK